MLYPLLPTYHSALHTAKSTQWALGICIHTYSLFAIIRRVRISVFSGEWQRSEVLHIMHPRVSSPGSRRADHARLSMGDGATYLAALPFARKHWHSHPPNWICENTPTRVFFFFFNFHFLTVYYCVWVDASPRWRKFRNCNRKCSKQRWKKGGEKENTPNRRIIGVVTMG